MTNDTEDAMNIVEERYGGDAEYVFQRLEQHYHGYRKDIIRELLNPYYYYLSMDDREFAENYSDSSETLESHLEYVWQECMDKIFDILDAFYEELLSATKNIESLRSEQSTIRTKIMVASFIASGVAVIAGNFADLPGSGAYVLALFVSGIVLYVLYLSSEYREKAAKKSEIAKSALL